MKRNILICSVLLTLPFMGCQKSDSPSAPDTTKEILVSPAGLNISYDTLNGLAILKWNSVPDSNLSSYVIYRNDSSSHDPQMINVVPKKDTLWADTIFHDTSGPLVRQLVYRLKSQDKNDNLSSTYSPSVFVNAPAPPNISINLPNSINDGQAFSISGKVRSGVPLTSIEYSIWSNGINVTDSNGISITSSSLASNRQTWDFSSDGQVKVTVKGFVPGNKFYFKVQIKCGSILKSDSAWFYPATESDIIGVWRTDVPAPGLPTFSIKILMEISADHTMLISQRLPTSDPNTLLEISKEYWSWTLVDGQLKSTKTACEYRDLPSYQLDQTGGCRAPLSKTMSLYLSGKTWTVDDNGSTVIFIKD